MSLSCPSLLSLQLLWCILLFSVLSSSFAGLCSAVPGHPALPCPTGSSHQSPSSWSDCPLTHFDSSDSFSIWPDPEDEAYSHSQPFNLFSHHFFTLSKALGKYPLTTVDLGVSWFKSLFSEPTKSQRGTIHWQSWHLYFKFTPFDFGQIAMGIWTAILNRFYFVLVGEIFCCAQLHRDLGPVLQNAQVHGRHLATC